jgi:ketosteroid isomerase-like protein
MSPHLETVQSLYAAFAQGDIPTILAAFAPDIRWIEAEGGPYGGTFVGPQAIVENVFAKIGSEWDHYAAVPQEFVGEAETIVALGTYSGTYRATGKSFQAPFAHIWKVNDGTVVSFQQITDTAVHQRPLHP